MSFVRTTKCVELQGVLKVSAFNPTPVPTRNVPSEPRSIPRGIETADGGSSRGDDKPSGTMSPFGDDMLRERRLGQGREVDEFIHRVCPAAEASDPTGAPG
jgi:hypothetical protein